MIEEPAWTADTLPYWRKRKESAAPTGGS